MATTKLYDLAVKTGEYQDRNGNTKGRDGVRACRHHGHETSFSLSPSTSPKLGVPHRSMTRTIGWRCTR